MFVPSDDGGNVAAKRQWREGRLWGARMRLYMALLNGRWGLRTGRNFEIASN
jgi:hypothetical protein